jgi:hypothetical protein
MGVSKIINARYVPGVETRASTTCHKVSLGRPFGTGCLNVGNERQSRSTTLIRPFSSAALERVLSVRSAALRRISRRPYTLLIVSLHYYVASARPVRSRGTWLVHAALESSQYYLFILYVLVVIK